ncbi:MAG: hypothetical protein ACM3QU_09470 [Verrucomicrobiota bacterium]
MLSRETRFSTPVGSFARAVFAAGFCLTVGTGIGLFAFPGRTADFWAWTIKAPLTAAFFGAGYIGAAVSLFLAARSREWRRARIVSVLAFTLTSLALVGTLRDLGPFAFREGGLPEVVAWIWLGVYVALPPLVLIAFLLQERSGGAREYGVEAPALVATRFLLGAAGVVVGVVGAGLVADWGWLTARWPWPLPALPATIVGAWFLTLAAGLLWFAIRERDWRRSRIGVAPMMVPLALDLVAAARLRDGFGGGTSTAVYLAGLVFLLVAIAAVTVIEEQRLCGPSPSSARTNLARGL